MAHATVRLRRREPVSVRDRLRRARVTLTAAIVPTYDLSYATRSGLLYEQAVEEGEFKETISLWWPTEERVLDTELAFFRDGDRCACYRFPGGTVARACLGGDSISVSIAGKERVDVEAAAAMFKERYPASFIVTDDSLVPITFWSLGPFGPQPRLRRIEASSWESIEQNYTAPVREELAALMAWDEPTADGQLILWQGEPGTGKTWALRALASEWSRWAEFHYITDPDSFFVDSPSYMVDVLLSESYSAIDETGDVYQETSVEGKWRVLILEDTGELLSVNAKEKYGQGLSRLLNVVDGMIGQGLRVLVLVTTNDELGELTPAVKRPGRCAAQIEFLPLTAEEAAQWAGDEDADGATLAELYGRDRSEPDTRAQIAEVAAKHQDEAVGYGETAWDAEMGTVLYVCGDWTDPGPIEADFLAIPGVEAFEHEAEALPAGWWEAEVVYPKDPPLWVTEREESAMDAVLELARAPLTPSEPESAPPIAPDLLAALGGVDSPIDHSALSVALEALAVNHRSTVEGISAMLVSAMKKERGGLQSDELAMTALGILSQSLTRPAAPAPDIHVHVPKNDLSVHVDAPTIEPRIDVHVPAAEPIEPPVVNVHVEAPEPIEQAAPIVNVHAASQPAPVVNVQVEAPVTATPRAVRVEVDDEGRKWFIPEETAV